MFKRKLSDREMKNIVGGVPAKKTSKLKIEDWVTELSLSLENYIGTVRIDGVYRLVEKPYFIKEITHYDNSNDKGTETIIEIDDNIGMYSDNVEEIYHLHVEKTLDNVKYINNLHASKMNLKLNVNELKQELRKLKDDGYKIDLYEQENEDKPNTHYLVAIKGKAIRYNIEKDFIELQLDKLETAKDFITK